MEQQLCEPSIVVRGDVIDGMTAYAREKLLDIVLQSHVPVLGVELKLDHHGDPARARPNHVEMVVDLDGVPVRVHHSAPTMSEAIDGAAGRLRRRLAAATTGRRDRRLRHRDQASWHHEDRPTERRDFYPRPAGERELLRRKTFALAPESIDEALFDLESLDHDFFLFVHDETDAEAVVYRVGRGYGLMQRVGTPEAIERVGSPLDLGPHPAAMTVETALSVLDGADAPFEFFIDASTGRGAVAYRRYDGHYGLISPT